MANTGANGTVDGGVASVQGDNDGSAHQKDSGGEAVRVAGRIAETAGREAAARPEWTCS